MDKTLGEIKAEERNRISRGSERDGPRERMADAQHAIWAHWIKYMFSVCEQRHDGAITIPIHQVERWTRQAETRYADLSESEKQSDRDIVKQFMGVELAILEAEAKMRAFAASG